MLGSSAPAFVEIEHATFRGPDGPVFAGSTLAISPGERWAVVGPNGSGKGLLFAGLMGKLRLLAGRLRHPFLEGDPRFVDSVFGVLPPGSMALASMKEHRQWLLARDFHQLRWHGSLSEGTATVGQLLQRGHVEERNPFAVLDEAGAAQFARAHEREIARCELGPLLHRKVVALSNGELHRFVLARALLRQPRLLFLDDPIAGLDDHSRERLRGILDELHAEGIGVVLATERESELPDGITHLLRVEAKRMRSAGPRRTEPARPKTPARGFSILKCPESEGPRLARDVPIAELRDVIVQHGDVKLLDGITWRVAQAEHWGLFGPNGSGKSTLLSLLLADNPQVHRNDVRVAGRGLGPGRSIWDQKAHLGWLSPELEAYYPPQATTLEVVLSGFSSSLGRYAESSPPELRAARAWLQNLDLLAQAPHRFADLPPVARRLALLARAAVHGPQLLLFDEPCQGLDTAGRATLRAAIAATAAALRAAMIYVTHDRDELPASVEHLLVLDRGRIQYLGPRHGWQTG